MSREEEVVDCGSGSSGDLKTEAEAEAEVDSSTRENNNNGSSGAYVAVAESEGEDPIEVPLEHDGGLLLTSVQSQFPSAVGLKFRNPTASNRSFRGVRLAEGVLYPPAEGGWGDVVYLVNTVKTQTDNKRKMEDSAQAEVSKTKRPTTQLSDLVVLNLPYHYTKENLVDYFSKHGEIAFAQIMKNASGESRGFAFIRFVNYEDQKRMNGCHFVIDGRKVHVKKPASQAPELCKVFVGRLTCRITKEDLTEHFEQFGPVSEVFFDAGRKQYGFVTFEESVSAEKALMHKAHYLKQTHIVVRPAEPVDKAKQSPNQPPLPPTSHNYPNSTPYLHPHNSPNQYSYNPSSHHHEEQQLSPYHHHQPSYSEPKFAPPSPYDGYSVPSPMQHSSSNEAPAGVAVKRSYQPQPPPLPPINHQPMSPAGPSAPIPQQRPAAHTDPGVFGQEMLTAMAKMMATAMSTGTFNAATQNFPAMSSGSMGVPPLHHPSTLPPPPMTSRMNTSYDGHSFRLSHSSANVHASHGGAPAPHYSHGGGAYRYPTVAMTNPYRSPPHDPYNNMY